MQYRAGTAKHDKPGIGGLDATAMPPQQRHADFLLQLLDSFAHSRGGNALHASCFCDALVLDNRDENARRDQVKEEITAHHALPCLARLPD